MYPLLEEASFPESLGSLEIVNTMVARRNFDRQVQSFFGGHPGYGTRGNEGHYLLWIHLSDRFVAAHPDLRQQLGDSFFMYPHRQTDIFTAWSGGSNLVDMLKEGLVGLGKPVEVSPGHLMGNFQSFSDAVSLGDADYEGGFYMTDDQAAKIVTAFDTYPGKTMGYSFLRTIQEKPNAPYEPAGAQMVNGYNCGDFAMYAVATVAGVIPRDTVEGLKIHLWYPEKYLNHPIPLAELGIKGYEWTQQNPNATQFPGDVLTKLGWHDLLFNPRGLTFFDKGAVADDIRETWPRVLPARIWDHASVIEWLRHHADFRAKGIVSELKVAVDNDWRIVSPDRTVPESADNHWRLSSDYAHYARKGARYMTRKLEAAGIAEGDDQMQFRELFNALKDHLGQ
ncbi:MAG TPA: hypothetical protein VL588_02725 [Bdellovibrionota bacterium]|nr:hypothetical protein [Bdellovibrionota bacterium]